MRGLWLLCCASILAITGCGGGLETGQVTGDVTYKGQPLKEGTITFHPEKGRPAHGKIVDGKIMDVTTMEKNDGALIGKQKVHIQSVSGGGDMYAKTKALIPEIYSTDKGGLTATIVSGPNTVRFDLAEKK